MKGNVTWTTREEIVTKAAIVLITPAPMKLMANGAPSPVEMPLNKVADEASFELMML
jgi:hypothetical protein